MLGNGLRKDALAHLSAFVQQATKWTFSEKKEFTSWLYHFIEKHTDTYLVIPHPLYEGFIKPTLIEWTEREPENSEPHRWLGTREHLDEAIRLNPADEIARSHLAEIVISWIEYDSHELPYGYIGNAEEDLQLLSEVEFVMSGISDEEKRSSYARRVAELRRSINAHLRGTEA